jgi:hypothetical protein
MALIFGSGFLIGVLAWSGVFIASYALPQPEQMTESRSCNYSSVSGTVHEVKVVQLFHLRVGGV